MDSPTGEASEERRGGGLWLDGSGLGSFPLDFRFLRHSSFRGRQGEDRPLEVVATHSSLLTDAPNVIILLFL